MNRKHFLLFQLRSVCYDSYTYFSEALAEALRSAGHETEIFSAEREPLDALERCIGMTFDAAIDFNSDLPKLKMEDGTFFLDHIQAPFFDVILDHPLYHHKMLEQPLKNFHVLCLDENHKTYIQTHYPHITSVHVLSVTGEDLFPEQKDYPQKDIDVLFSGTYTDPRQIDASMDSIPGFLGSLTRSLLDLMRQDPALTQEAALNRLLPSLEEAEIIQETFPLHMQACFLCDSFLRAEKREQLLLSIAAEHLPLTLCGNGWRNSPLADFPQVQIIDDISFRDTFTLFRRSKITLNLLPEFKNGTHDRVYSSMLNHSLCLTDPSPMLQEQFTDDVDICFYDTRKPENLTSKIRHLLSSSDLLIPITQSGYENAKRNHTWAARGASFLKILDSLV